MDDTFTDEDAKTLDEFTLEPNTTAIERAPRGRFAKGNKEGRKFQKGYSGKPKGSRNRKTLIAREFAMDVLYLDPKTGKEMTYHQLCMYTKKKADSSPRILNLLLDHALGKPPEHIQQEQVVFVLHGPDNPQENTQDAVVIDAGQFSLPEGEEEE